MTRVLVDIQGSQSADHRDRGVARYILALARALQERHGDRIASFLLNPDLTPPDGIEPLVAARALSTIDDAAVPAGGIYHVASPYELTIPLERLWPARVADAGLRLVVTLYDVIPEVFADHYLSDPGLRRRYRARHHLVRAADRVLAISQATADDAVDRLGLDPARVVVVGGGVDDRFTPGRSGRPGARSPREQPYVLYTGGIDHRKNLDALIEAWARLPVAVRDRWHLVVVCSVDEPTRHHYDVMAERLGISGGLVLTGFVPDHELIALYQHADLFVFPSLYEGYGLPVAEALACGTPTVAAAGSSLDELTVPEARFDPREPASIAAAIERGLTDEAFRRLLLDAAARPAPRWGDVADRVAAVYDDVLDRPPRWGARRRRGRPRIAFVSPLPPQPSGVATYSARLVEHLRDHADVDLFVDGPRTAPAPEGAYLVDNLLNVEGSTGGYDDVVYCVGNSEFHGGALSGLRRRPGIVVAHDVRLVNLYFHGAHRHRAVPEGFHAALHAMYDRLPPDLGARGYVTEEEADRWGLLMAREVIARSTRFLTMSGFAADLARLDADPAHCDRIGVLPFGVRPPLRADGTPREERLVATFGVVHEIKQTSKLVRAMSEPPLAGAQLAIVGPISDEERARLLALDDRIVITGSVSDEDYERWLRRATVAVQLRASTNGESSAAVADCLAAGLPTIVTRLGAARELPAAATVHVAPEVTAADLAAEIAALLDDEARRASMSAAAVAHAEAHGFDAAAAALLAALSSAGAAGPPA